MSTHINAEQGQIAERVLLPGDPLRAKFIAENFLENVECYNTVRNMLGFTGTYKGKRVSVQGTGMGIPSIGIYAHELICDYGCKRLIRTGTCGSYMHELQVGDMIIANAAATDSAVMKTRFGRELTFPAVADFMLTRDVVATADRLGMKYKVGTVYSTDLFYAETANDDLLMRYGVCGVEMEAAELFMLGARHKVQTLGIMTVSDMIFEKGNATAEQREKTFTDMMVLALEAI